MSGLDFIVSRWLFLFKAVQLSVFRLLTLKMANLICIVFSRGIVLYRGSYCFNVWAINLPVETTPLSCLLKTNSFTRAGPFSQSMWFPDFPSCQQSQHVPLLCRMLVWHSFPQLCIFSVNIRHCRFPHRAVYVSVIRCYAVHHYTAQTGQLGALFLLVS